MTNLITPAEFAIYRDISKKLDEDKINEAISLAQQSDLLEILGDFYFDVTKNAAESEYADLMNGSVFTYCDLEYEHAGIKRLLGDYTYARHVYMANVNPTAFGFQEKFTDDSKGVDRNLIKDLAKQAQYDAGVKFKIIKLYLLSDPDTFSRFCEGQNPGTSFSHQRISKL